VFMNPNIESSYMRNAMGKILYDAVIEIGAKEIVDFGVLNGYSTICLAKAAKITGGRVYAYDLFDDYKYNGSKFEIFKKNIRDYEVDDVVDVKKMNFDDWTNNKHNFDLLHVDVSNTGDTILKIACVVTKNLNENCKVFFEGGSEKRDKQDWMLKYSKKPILSVKDLINFTVLAEDEYEDENGRKFFPAISTFCKKDIIKKW